MYTETRNKRLYNIWACMKQRCNNPKNTAAKWYHDRGIRVCDCWNDDFLAFQSWALDSGYSEKLTIDRIDPDGNYCPENCRWVTRRENCSKTRQPQKKIRQIGCTPKKGRYEVWDAIINYRATVVKTGLMYSDAKRIAREFEDELRPKPGRIFMVRKCKPLHKEGDSFRLKGGTEILTTTRR